MAQPLKLRAPRTLETMSPSYAPGSPRATFGRRGAARLRRSGVRRRTFGKVSARSALLWTLSDSLSLYYREHVVPIFIDRGAPRTRKRMARPGLARAMTRQKKSAGHSAKRSQHNMDRSEQPPSPRPENIRCRGAPKRST